MLIEELTGTSELAGNGASATSNEASLGREDFLRMLVAQLENQDPLNPQESTEFTAQLAQFSSLEQEIGMRATLEQIATALTGGEKGTAIDLIGQNVLVSSPQFELIEGEEATLSFDLASASDSTKLSIRNFAGNVVTSFDLGDQTSGLQHFRWDGRDHSGQQLPPGVYSLEIEALSEFQPVGSTAVLAGRVSGADVSTSNPTVRLGEIVVPLAAVREVRGTSTGTTP